MNTEKRIKEEFRMEASSEPEKHYPVKTLQEHGFKRYKCKKCGKHFWSHHKQEVCGDPACSGGFRFIGKPVTKKKLDYITAWKTFKKIHENLGYTAIKRYPTVARWNPTTDFTIASIAAFQPYVVTGEIPPPANPLVIPQMVIRFPDIDNVGITGHLVGFVMLGQHAFMPPEKYNPNKYLQDHLTWINKGMGLENKNITIHEDVWAGGGNYGPCVEIFSEGLEISNQVYMQYEMTKKGTRALNIKVLDMGQGLERIPWFTNGGPSIYEYAFPPIIKKLKKITGIKIDEKLMKKFTPLAPYLNTGEVENIEKAWQNVAEQLNITVKELKNQIIPTASLYSIAEHTRALLVAINDGALPSNVGGMHNLRVIFRRAQGFIDKYKWDINMGEVAEWHADYLQPMFPELIEGINSVKEILDVEKKKYYATLKRTKTILPRILDKEITADKLVEIYDSQGIPPELIKKEAEKKGKKIEIPANFYALLAERHEETKREIEREDVLELKGVKPTEILYYEDYTKTRFDGKVLAIFGNKTVLDKTAFYPEGGGQASDTGTINGEKVIDVQRQGPWIIHIMKEKPKFHAGDTIKGEIDFDRRVQLTQHHTATHIVNAAARIILGKHVNQAGAKKDVEKAHLDITHYESLTPEQTEKIEEKANEIVNKGIKIKSTIMNREEAERKYGMTIYQGGAVPGKKLRIVEIENIDVEACGGTHLKNTLETGKIKIIKTTKIQDGVVRLVFTAGKATEAAEEKQNKLLEEIAKVLKVEIKEIPARAQELFEKWKQAVKKKKKMSKKELELTAKKKLESSNEEILEKTAEILKTQPEYILNTIKRFMKELEEVKEKQFNPQTSFEGIK
ncbi:alanine--tRNA ligase [Candidatus Woesearchaeota archaeon ex4484_78]|nr:MAG: alanine--tRNA ligase [Candidatus Woesearchaeota archaeon ex4484_78]